MFKNKKNTFCFTFSLQIYVSYDRIYLSRFSTVVVRMHGKHERRVRFSQLAPLTNLFELFEL